MHRVRFTALEFDILWAAYGTDRLPYPLQYRPLIDEWDALKRERERAVETLLANYEPLVERALVALRAPDARVEIKGFADVDDSTVIRFHGAIRDNVGTTLRQLPGPASDIGGDVVIGFGRAEEVASEAVNALPACRPGTLPPIEIRRDRLNRGSDDAEYHLGMSYATEHLTRVVDRPRSSFGEVAAYAGGAIDSRPTPSIRTFWWMDYPDGRYYVRTGDPIIAEPLDAARMTTGIAQMLNRAQRVHTESRTDFPTNADPWRASR
ncbi:ESX secretion-associated protein EspG [Nocardia camponoti]|uniref:ESX secretion-associated protein EspG n=1 Tax=Nocardia camponoti TaxID=1616106 RepID=A0A917QA00_9NOCA|nr:ESX secretion-associated protein EspG [Nocardia camponoti]GGK38639.1 hypothetical protein GCM10011591_07980 [Nocardia camponoti]